MTTLRQLISEIRTTLTETKTHDIKPPDYGGPDARYVRHRQLDPERFEKGSLRTITLGKRGKKRVKGVIGKLKGGNGKTRLQTILVPKSKKA